MISFNRMPGNLRVPGTYVEIDNTRAVQGALLMPSRVLHFGQMLATGTATPGEPTRVTSVNQARAAFGRGSMLAALAAVHFAARPAVELHALPTTDAAGATASTRAVSVDSAPTAAGTVALYIGGRRYAVGVAAGDEPGAIAASIVERITADADAYVTAEADGSTVTLTARHGGLDAGDIAVHHSHYQGEALPEGVALTISDLTAGATNPSIDALLPSLGDEWYQTFVMPWSDAANLRAMEAELDSRFGPERMIEAHAYAAVSGSVNDVAAAGESRNSPHLTLADAGITIAPAWCLAAADAAIDAGEPDPARPRQTLTVPASLVPVRESQRRTYTQRNTLLYAGIATHTVSPAGVIQIERLITTYEVGNDGIEDESYLDVCTLRTVAYMRYDWRRLIALRYPRHKLADDGTPVAPGQAIVTPAVLRAEAIAMHRGWMEIGIAENPEQFKRDLVVERNAADPNRIDAVIPPDCINQLRVVAAKLEFRL